MLKQTRVCSHWMGTVLTRWYGQSSVKNVFIRGSVVRYVHLPGAAVDTALLEDATRRGTLNICLIGGVS